MKTFVLILIGLYLVHTCDSLLTNIWKVSRIRSIRSTSLAATTSETIHHLPSKLKALVDNLRQVQDDKLRYQQLLYMAARAKPMNKELKIDTNKVQGCLSTVHVHAMMDENSLIQYTGDSDALLTKGLVVMLVEGLSGCTADEINQVDPSFIAYAGISNSLTPGRNNGFLNMLKLMKVKANQLKEQRSMNSPQDKAKSEAIESANKEIIKSTDESKSVVFQTENTLSDRPIYNSMMKKLKMLQPVSLEIEDESHQHAGHSGMAELGKASGSGETHFQVKIVSKVFQGLSLVQRHRMIYTLLQQEMNQGVHALSISAKTPDE